MLTAESEPFRVMVPTSEAERPSVLLRGRYGDPVSLHDVAHVPVRAHRPVVPVVLYAGLQGDHIPAVLRAGDFPGLVRRNLLEAADLVGVRGAVGVAQVDDVANLKRRQVVKLVEAPGARP